MDTKGESSSTMMDDDRAVNQQMQSAFEDTAQQQQLRTSSADDLSRNRRRSEAIVMRAANHRNSVRQQSAENEEGTPMQLKVGSLSDLIPSLSSSGDLDSSGNFDILDMAISGATSSMTVSGGQAQAELSLDLRGSAEARKSRTLASPRDTSRQISSPRDDAASTPDSSPASNKRISMRKREILASEDVGGPSEKELREASIAEVMENSQGKLIPHTDTCIYPRQWKSYICPRRTHQRRR